MASITSRSELCPVLDSDLFTFKPKLNDKSNEIAQNLLSNFYERQLKHQQRLQEFQEIAAGNYREWYCHDKRTKNRQENTKLNSETQSAVDEPVSNDDKEPPASSGKAHQLNDRIAKLIQAYGSSLPKKTKLPAILLPIRQTKRVPRQSAPAQLEVQEPVKPSSSSSSPPPESPSLPSSLPTAPVPPPPASSSPPPPVLPPPSSSSPPPLPHAPVLAPIVKGPTRRVPAPVRPKTPPKVVRRVDSPPRRPLINDTINPERLRLAREEAERAIKDHKIFTIIGPYPALRDALRRRGWIEKFDRALLFPPVHDKKKSDKKHNKSDDDDDDDDDEVLGDDDLNENPLDGEDNGIPPWEENDGYYGILSRLVKSAVPDLVWTVQATYDTSTLNKDQMVNHYERNGCLTTKVGLCSSLKSLPWFHSGCADEFYPRCYKLTHDDERTAFIDDYRLTACISFLKLVRNRCKGTIEPNINASLDMSLSQPSLQKVPSTFTQFALEKVEQFTLARDHEDIDIKQNSQKDSTEEQWKKFIEQFYAASHSYAEIDDMKTYLNRIEKCLKNVEEHWPQYNIDGTRNIWISKPGAMSRGRGIVVYDRLDDMLKLCTSTVSDKAKFIVQKYIERPLLVHNTKFDIRQWFLVTDWNPLTIWMYKDCYFRFCTEHFSLATRNQNVHLCNYSVQKHYKNNSNRHSDLPAENMWTSPEFIDKYLRPKKLAGKWDSFIYPAMKDAIICSMLVAQDTIDTRKNSFELYGADFMLGEDLQPWLIEINCSPTMARCTAVTKEMCDSVLEDTVKVIIDRKYDRVEETGRFELIHKGIPVPIPNYVGIDLRVEGKHCKTGRTYNNNNQSRNNNNTKNNVPASAPLETNSSKTGQLESNSSHSISALAIHTDTSLKTNKKTSSTIDMNDSSSSNDLISEKTSLGFTTKPSKAKRISADTLPIDKLNRSKTNDAILLSSSSKENKDNNVSKINVGEIVFEDEEIKSPGNLPFFNRLQNTLLPHKKQDEDHSKILQRQETIFDSASNISTSSTIHTDNEHTTVISVA
ncbi:unnamed protein product [Adineta steineri]|uniref:Uncharacterized protein n=1 Tax=Adineta steineri TaxID=433720 RepID=A0A815QD72_9BILA|nr:unnamed protein product [Adineta steineri]